MLVTLIVTLVIIGVVLWCLEQLPLDATIKTIIRVLVILFALLYVLSALGFLPHRFLR